MKITDNKREIHSATILLTRLALLKTNNFPTIIGNDLVWSGFQGVSAELKQEEYSFIYENIRDSRNFNFMFLDGGIIQMMYRYDRTGKKLESHRLTFYPDPNSVQLGEDPDEYEERIYGLRKFGDLVYRSNVATPVRFDYSSNEGLFREYEHSHSHLSFGGYKSCRITVSGPIGPKLFIDFILKSFYFEKYKDCSLYDKLSCGIKFSDSITSNESRRSHFLIR